MRQSPILTTWQRTQQHWYWLIPSVLALGAIAYSIYRSANATYWDGAIGNLLATMLGIIAGVPVALALERRRAGKEEQERAIERKDRAIKVLSMIRDELNYNLRELGPRRTNPTTWFLRPFKDTLWQALSDGGEIAWINDPQMLSQIASAYFYVKIVAAIEEKSYEARRARSEDFNAQSLLADARTFDQDFHRGLSEAIAAIDTVTRDNPRGEATGR